MKEYRPIPESLTIGKSNIEGLGVFATQDIPKMTIFGEYPTHYHKNDGETIRITYGGWINHSPTPNCILLTYNNEYDYLATIKDIKQGEELTVNYRTTKCGKCYVDIIKNKK